MVDLKAENSADKPWRKYIKFQRGERSADSLDDVTIIVHEGDLFRQRTPVAFAKVRIVGYHKRVFQAVVIVPPRIKSDVKKGSRINFVAPESWEYPIMVSDSYLEEIGAWKVGPCNKCASTLILDSPSNLVKQCTLQPPAGVEPKSFTSFCHLCGGGTQVLTRIK